MNTLAIRAVRTVRGGLVRLELLEESAVPDPAPTAAARVGDGLAQALAGALTADERLALAHALLRTLHV